MCDRFSKHPTWLPKVAIGLALMMALPDFVSAAGGASERAKKPRVIVTTDGEGDDRCSMVRFLLYTNDWNVLGLIHSSSKHHWKGDANHQGKNWEPVSWLDRQLDAYEKVYSNLKSHDANYPSPSHLRSQVFVGNIALEGDMRSPTAGSDRIVQVLLDPDSSPVWLQAWGGSNTIARALKTIQEEHPDRMKEVSRKAHLYLIGEQDNTLKTYLRPQWPDLQILRCGGPSYGAIAYRWTTYQPKEIQAFFDRTWMADHMLQGHGPLCSMYEARDGQFRSEGDTPAFLHVITNGLRSDEDPSYGGWGGRFGFDRGIYRSVDAENAQPHSILRWAIRFQNDWAARADWCVEPPSNANHPPQVNVVGDLDRPVQTGDRVLLNAEPSVDPDGDSLSFRWWQYVEAGTWKGETDIKNSDKSKASLVIPSKIESGMNIHIICEVTDDGIPSLTRYQRVILSAVK